MTDVNNEKPRFFLQADGSVNNEHGQTVLNQHGERVMPQEPVSNLGIAARHKKTEPDLLPTSDASEYIAGQLFDACTASIKCEEIKCNLYGGRIAGVSAFNCGVFDEDLPPHNCPIVCQQMEILEQSFQFWVEDNLHDAEETSNSDSK